MGQLFVFFVPVVFFRDFCNAIFFRTRFQAVALLRLGGPPQKCEFGLTLICRAVGMQILEAGNLSENPRSRKIGSIIRSDS